MSCSPKEWFWRTWRGSCPCCWSGVRGLSVGPEGVQSARRLEARSRTEEPRRATRRRDNSSPVWFSMNDNKPGRLRWSVHVICSVLRSVLLSSRGDSSRPYYVTICQWRVYLNVRKLPARTRQIVRLTRTNVPNSESQSWRRLQTYLLAFYVDQPWFGFYRISWSVLPVVRRFRADRLHPSDQIGGGVVRCGLIWHNDGGILVRQSFTVGPYSEMYICLILAYTRGTRGLHCMSISAHRWNSKNVSVKVHLFQ